MKCDELKAYNVVVTDECADYICGQKQLEFEAYAADDVDAAIAELERKVDLNKRARQYWRKEWILEYKENCHQKYKRCMAMAHGCEYLCAHYQFREVYKKRDFFRKWMFRWMELAYKFKEGNDIIKVDTISFKEAK